MRILGRLLSLLMVLSLAVACPLSARSARAEGTAPAGAAAATPAADADEGAWDAGVEEGGEDADMAESDAVDADVEDDGEDADVADTDMEDDGAGRAIAGGVESDGPDWTEALDEATAAAEAVDGLEVYFLDLGRVDGILIRCEGATSFIDVGHKKDAAPAIKYLKYLGVDHLDSYIASHAHDDHIGGAARIINAFRPETIYVNRDRCLSAILAGASSSEAKSVKSAQAVVLKSGDTFSIGGAQVKCLGPSRITRSSTAAYAENYNSLILRMDYNGHSFLFTGDTHDRYLREANRRFPGELNVDVLKNPHHNGKHDADVIKLISPKITVFCTANENPPPSQYQRLLKSLGSEVYVTGSDRHGNVVIACRGDEMDVRLGYPMTDVQLRPVPALYAGQEYNMKGKLEPARYGKVRWISWKSSDTSVVRVSGAKLRAMGPGTATVTATTFNGLSASVDVEVFSALVLLEHYELSIAVGEEKKLRAKIVPEGQKGVTGEWISADPSILVVTRTGELIGAKEGTTQAIARLSNGVEAACNVTVSGFPVDSVDLDVRKAKLKVGEVLKLNATVKPDYFGDTALEWGSSDERVLWVDMDGNVTAVGKGTAKIGVRSANGKYDVCTIRVE